MSMSLKRHKRANDRMSLTTKINPILLESNPPGITTSRRRGKSETDGKNSRVDSPVLGTGNGNLRRTEVGSERRSGRSFASIFTQHVPKRKQTSTSTQLRRLRHISRDPEAAVSPTFAGDDRGSDRDFVDDESVISGGGTRFHGFDMVGEPLATPIAVLPQVCSLEGIPRELEEFAQANDARELLVDAVFARDERTVKNLLINSFNPTSGESFELGLTLLIASWSGHDTLVRYLLSQYGVDLTFSDNRGRTALHFAALAGSAETVSILVKAGAPVNVWDRDQPVTPLCCAASVGSVECCRILVDAGAAIEFGSEPNAVSALYHAVLVNAVDCVKYLVGQKANVNFGQVFSETPVHIAAAEGFVECLKVLLDNGGNVVLKGTNGMTPLHLAAKDGVTETVDLLIKAGGDVNAPNNMNRTPLHLAALAQTLDCIELLLKAGADPNAEDVDLKTPLHSAIVKAARNCDCVKVLLDAGADPNKQDNSGFTPLHLAVINEFSPCVQLLLERGGDVTIKTNGGKTVLSYMVRKTPDTLAKLRDMFNQSISLSADLNDREEIHFNFKVLKPPSNNHEMLLFTNLIQAGQRRLLVHPLCESFLHLKWQKIRKFFVFNLIVYIAFVVVLTAYVLMVFRERCLHEDCDPVKVTRLMSNGSAADNGTRRDICKVEECLERQFGTETSRRDFIGGPWVTGVWWALIVLTFVLMAKEVFQVAQNFREYFKTYENLLQILTLGLTCTLFRLNYPHNYFLPEWKYHCAAFTIFLSWVELMFFVGRFPMHGLFIQMFIIVLKDFGKFFVAYSAILAAFAMSFAVVFPRHNVFRNVGDSILTTFVMMTGEFEYSDGIFFNDDGILEYPGTSHILFGIFVLLVSIIMMNLLVGMAVNDIQGLQKTAKLERLVRQTELIAHIESTVLSNLFSFLPGKVTRFLHNQALLVPELYRWIFFIRCNDPRDKRLPRDIVDAAYKLAKSTRNESKFNDHRSHKTGRHHGQRRGFDRNAPRQRSNYSEAPVVAEASVWTEAESQENIEQIKRMLSTLQLDKEYLERKVEETEEAVLELKNQLAPLMGEVLDILKSHRRRTGVRRRSRVVHQSSDDDEDVDMGLNVDDEDEDEDGRKDGSGDAGGGGDVTASSANVTTSSRPHSVATTAAVDHSTLSSSRASTFSVPFEFPARDDSSPESSSVRC